MFCEVIEKYLIATSLLSSTEKRAKDYGVGDFLYHAEINLLEAIYRWPESNATQLSKILNVTRGAITQKGNKLEEKGLIERFYKGVNKKEKYYTLTEYGRNIRKNHEKYHDEANNEICKYLSGLSGGERTVIINFLEKIADLPISGFECRCHRCDAESR